MHQAEFEPAIPVSERPQTHALDRAATGIGFFTGFFRLNAFHVWNMAAIADVAHLHVTTVNLMIPKINDDDDDEEEAPRRWIFSAIFLLPPS